MEKHVIFEASMLTNVKRGIHTRWTYYSDGSMETSYFYGSPAILTTPLWIY